MSGAGVVQIPDRAFFRIGDVSDLLKVKPYVLRYWETEFTLVSPQKSSTGQRVYKRADVEALLLIKHLLYNEGYSIDGARKRIRELKKVGELQDFQQQKVLGSAEDHQNRRKKMENCLKLAREAQKLAKLPMSELFKL